MNCPSCGNVVVDATNFCPFCGKRLNKEMPKSDFEIGKIAALDTIKSDVLNWLLRIAGVGALIGIFGIHEYVKLAVDSSVKGQLGSLSQKIEKASADAEDSTARARIESKQLDSTIDALGTKATDLSKSVDAVARRKIVCLKLRSSSRCDNNRW